MSALIYHMTAVSLGALFFFLFHLFMTTERASHARFFLPRLYQRWKFRRYQSKFQSEFPDCVTLMANCLRSGLGFLQAVMLIAEEGAPLCRLEFKGILDDVRLGISVEEAFEKMAKRIGLEDVEILSNTISTLRKSGGNVIETFEAIVKMIRERKRVSDRIAIYTAQGKSQAAIIMGMPFFLILALQWISPDFMEPLFFRPAGWCLLATAAALLLCGGLLIRQIVSIKV